MKAALAWIKEALSTKPLTPLYSYFLVKDRMIYATDGRMWAAHPFPSDHTFCVSGYELSSLIERLPDPINIKVNDNDTITLSSGRLRGIVKTVDPKDWPFQDVTAERIELPTRLLPALRQLRPFISENATKPFAMCVRAANNTLYATNNVVAVAAPEIDLDETNILIPYWAVDFVLGREGVTHWSHAANDYIAFHWDNGAWFRSKLVDDTFPEQVERIINTAGFAGVAITDEWRKAYVTISELVDDEIVLTLDGMHGKNKDMDVENETGTQSPDIGYSGWSSKFLQPVIELATHWQPTTYPKPSPFRGDGVIGVIVGRRIKHMRKEEE